MNDTNTFELELTGMAHGGSAIGRHAGRIIFVPYAIPGERIIARITEDKGRFANAEIVEVLDPAPGRTAPVCKHFGACGGCQWQHIDYPAQLRFKREVMIDQLQRIGKLDAPNVAEPLPSPGGPWAYRVKATFHTGKDGQLGYWSHDNSRIIPIEECHIIRPELVALLDELAFEETPEIDKARLQVGSDGALMITLSAADDQPPALETDLPVSINFLLSDNVPVNLIGSASARYEVNGRRFRVTAGGFFQVNPPAAGLLVDEAMHCLNLRGGESVLDLYSGVGLFSAFIAEDAALVTAVESYPPAVTDAEVNLAEFDNVDLIEGTVEDVLPDAPGPYDLAVVDPPRAGMEPAALDALAAHAPRVIVYVSCDPATLARDAMRLSRHGYALETTQPVDMFPQTFHIESVSRFVRR
ncbi:MAG: class I SAM-dependent RNA methyltransferase [Anaerolineae bacterium]|nr:class I SAM-dependent RNA methyltransferase [Anaerolineae bacterium]